MTGTSKMGQKLGAGFGSMKGKGQGEGTARQGKGMARQGQGSCGGSCQVQ